MIEDGHKVTIENSIQAFESCHFWWPWM